MTDSLRDRLGDVHPQMLRSGFAPDPQKLGITLEQHKRELGQALDWALDKARITKQAAALAMGYTDSGVIGRWVSGTERIQNDKLRLLGDVFWGEWVVAQAALTPYAEVETHIRLKVG